MSDQNATEDFITISEGVTQSVNAKELYDKLGLRKKNWSRWCKVNILENPFAVEHEDYEGFLFERNGNQTLDFALSIPFAKKLAMQVKTEAGEKVREYFLECERRAKAAAELQQPPPKPAIGDEFPYDLLIRMYPDLEEHVRVLPSVIRTGSHKIISATLREISEGIESGRQSLPRDTSRKPEPVPMPKNVKKFLDLWQKRFRRTPVFAHALLAVGTGSGDHSARQNGTWEAHRAWEKARLPESAG